MDETIVNKILKTMKQNRRGKIFFTNDFAKFGDYKSCNKALERLSKQGDIMRVTRGIYTIPQKSKYTGDALAPIDETVRAIVKRDKAKIVPTGLFALNILHLSTQVPAKKVYLTDGAPRKFKIGKNTIILKKTTPRNVATKGKISTLAIQALKELKKDYVTEEQIEKIVGFLKKENPQHLEHDIKLAPLWIQKIMRKAQTENN